MRKKATFPDGRNLMEFFMRRIFLALAICAAPIVAQAEQPTIEGSWSGSGTISTKGAVDQVRCRVRNTRAASKTSRYLPCARLRMGTTTLQVR
jgi:hypothetical protein